MSDGVGTAGIVGGPVDARDAAPLSLARIERQLEALELEIARISIIGGIPLLDKGVAERVLCGDRVAGSRASGATVRKLAALIVLHRALRVKADRIAGPRAADEMARAVRRRLRSRIGAQLGGTSGHHR